MAEKKNPGAEGAAPGARNGSITQKSATNNQTLPATQDSAKSWRAVADIIVGKRHAHEHGFAGVAADGRPLGFFTKQINALSRRENPSPVGASDGRKQCLPAKGRNTDEL
jgi:hypothetical protein